MRIFFPLRSNAHALMVGSSLGDVRRRIKMAALLHDEVVIDAGSFHVTVGTAGFNEMRIAPGKGPDEGWQTSLERSRAVGQEPLLLIDGHEIRFGKNLIYWRPTFEPLRRELPPAYPWIEFASVDLNQNGKNLVNRLVQEDEQNPTPLPGIKEPAVHRAVLKQAITDAFLGTAIDAAVSADRLHGQICRDLAKRGQAHQIPGEGTLRTIFPDVRDLPWEEVDRVRRHRGWRSLRDLWQEIEMVARSDAYTLEEVEYVIRDEYATRLREAEQAAAGSLGRKFVLTAFGRGFGIVLGQLQLPEPVGTVVGGAIGLGIEHVVTNLLTPRWLAADYALSGARSRATAQ